MRVVYYSTPAGNSQPVAFIDDLEADDAAAIVSDIDALARYGRNAPIQLRVRTFFVQRQDSFWILHVCKKQDQRRGIEAAAKRMEKLPGEKR